MFLVSFFSVFGKRLRRKLSLDINFFFLCRFSFLHTFLRTIVAKILCDIIYFNHIFNIFSSDCMYDVEWKIYSKMISRFFFGEIRN